MTLFRSIASLVVYLSSKPKEIIFHGGSDQRKQSINPDRIIPVRFVFIGYDNVILIKSNCWEHGDVAVKETSGFD